MGFWEGYTRARLVNDSLNHQREIAEIIRIRTLINLARGKYDHKQYEAALAVYEEALALAQIDSSPKIQVMISNEMADCYEAMGQTEDEIISLKFGLKCAVSGPDVADVSNRLGIIYSDRLGKPTEGLEYFREAAQQILGRDHGRLECAILRNLAVQYQELGNNAKALKPCKMALSRVRWDKSVGDLKELQELEHELLFELGKEYHASQKHIKALRYYRKALRSARRAKLTDAIRALQQLEYQVLRQLGKEHRDLGRTYRAKWYYGSALRKARRAGYTEDVRELDQLIQEL